MDQEPRHCLAHAAYLRTLAERYIKGAEHFEQRAKEREKDAG
jgi:hypothetical protein